jgi:hypothetical protein
MGTVEKRKRGDTKFAVHKMPFTMPAINNVLSKFFQSGGIDMNMPVNGSGSRMPSGNKKMIVMGL